MSQIKNKFIEAASGSTLSGVTDVNIRLRNAQPLRARNAANSADVNILSVSAADVITMAGPLSMGTNKITNLVNPTAGSQEAATANYVDAAIIAAAGANTALSNLITTSINQSLIPNGDVTKDLGTNALRWRDGYLNNLKDDSGVISISVGNRYLADVGGTPIASYSTGGRLSLQAGVTLDLNGSTSGTIRLQAADTTTNYTIKYPDSQGAASTFLQNDGSGNLSWATAGAGTVTSVALTAPSIFSVAGSPVTSSGTLAITYSGTALPVANGGTNSTTALNNNRIIISSGSAIVENAAITANRALISDGSGIPTASTVTNTELGYVSGVTSSIQTQLNGKLNLSGGTMSGAINMGANQINNMADPSSAQDAATKYYVDQVAQGLKPKQAVRVGTLANINLASGPASIDGVTLTSGDRVLVKDQTASEDNGIYDYNGSGNALTRSADFDSLTPIDEINGAYTFIQEGTQAGQGWVQQGTVTVIGTDPIVFVYFSSATTVIGGDMITVTGGDTVSVDLATVSGLESTNPGNPAGQLRAKVNAPTIKINGSNELEGLKSTSENLTLNGTDITNQYKDISFAAYGTSASVNSVVLSVVGGPIQQKTVDYTVSLTGGAGGVTRITFAGDLATGGVAALVSGDILVVSYSYLT